MGKIGKRASRQRSAAVILYISQEAEKEMNKNAVLIAKAAQEAEEEWSKRLVKQHRNEKNYRNRVRAKNDAIIAAQQAEEQASSDAKLASAKAKLASANTKLNSSKSEVNFLSVEALHQAALLRRRNIRRRKDSKLKKKKNINTPDTADRNAVLSVVGGGCYNEDVLEELRVNNPGEYSKYTRVEVKKISNITSQIRAEQAQQQGGRRRVTKKAVRTALLSHEQMHAKAFTLASAKAVVNELFTTKLREVFSLKTLTKLADQAQTSNISDTVFTTLNTAFKDIDGKSLPKGSTARLYSASALSKFREQMDLGLAHEISSVADGNSFKLMLNCLFVLVVVCVYIYTAIVHCFAMLTLTTRHSITFQ